MARVEEGGRSLQERVNSFLRGSPSYRDAFSARPSRDEIAFHEYLLEKAEVELRAAQAQVDELKKKLAKLRE